MTEKRNRKLINHLSCAECNTPGVRNVHEIGKKKKDLKKKGEKKILLRESRAVEMEVLGEVGHHVAGSVS